MDKILVLQYKRRHRRLQMLVIPFSYDSSISVFIRLLPSSGQSLGLTEGWRVVPAIGMEITLKISGLEDFVADVAMKEVFESGWMAPESVSLEAKGLISPMKWDFGDFIAGRMPVDLLERIKASVDGWV